MVSPIEQHVLTFFLYYHWQDHPTIVCEHNMDKFYQPKKKKRIIEIIPFISFRK
jgi:hypothetical protein